MKDTKTAKTGSLESTFLSHSIGSIKSSTHRNNSIRVKELIDIWRKPPTDTKRRIKIIRKTTKELVSNPLYSSLKDVLRTQKSVLNFSIIGGTSASGHKQENITPNGLIQIDIDIKTKGGDKTAEKVKELLKKFPYTLAVAISPSGYGIKGIMRLKTAILEPKKYKCAVSVINGSIAAFLKEQGLDSKALKTLSFDTISYNTPCYDTHDQDAFYNESAKLFEYKERKVVKPSKQAIKNNIATNSPLSIELQRRAAKIATLVCQNGKEGTPFLQQFVPMVIKFGVERDIAKEALNESEMVFKPKHFQKLDEMYSRYNYQFLSNRFSLFNRIDTSSDVQVLKEGKKLLGNIRYDMYKSGCLVSPTGSGKSYFATYSTTDKKIIVVPTQALVEEFEERYNATPFYEGKNELLDRSCIVVTYSSFSRLSNLVDLSEYILIIDEAHNFTSATSKAFQLKELRSVIDKLNEARCYHLFTATPLLNVHPYISHLPITVIKEAKPVKRNYQYLTYSKNRIKAILNFCKQNKKEGVQSYVLFNNKKKQLKELQELLEKENINFAALNSTTKKELEHKQIVIEGDSSNFDAIVATTVLKEGTSITKHRDDCKFLIVGYFHPNDMEQFSGRPRNITERNVYLLCRDSKEWQCTDTYGEREYKILLNGAESLRDEINILLKRDRTQAYKDKRVLDVLEESSVFINEEHCAEVCLLNISNRLYEQEKQAANIDKEYMNDYLAIYGWEQLDASGIDSEETAQETEIRRQRRKESKEVEAAIRNELYNGGSGLNGLKNETVQDFEREIAALEKDLKNAPAENDTTAIKNELKERRQIVKVWEMGFFKKFKEVIEAIEATGGKRASYLKLKNTILIQQAVKNGMKETKERLSKYINGFEVGKTYTAIEATQILNDIKSQYDQPPISNRAAFNKLSYFFELDHQRTNKQKTVRIVSRMPLQGVTIKTEYQKTVTDQSIYKNLPF